MARFAYRHRRRLQLVSKIVPDANLFDPPPRRRGKKVGRHAVKGKSLPSPADVVAANEKGKRIKVRWYGGGWRNVEVITGTGGWFKSGKGLVMIRWVYVRDLDGTLRDEYCLSTDTSMTPQAIVEMYGGRWNIETTFQEFRAHLGLETTRGGGGESDGASHGTGFDRDVHARGDVLRHDAPKQPASALSKLVRQGTCDVQ